MSTRTATAHEMPNCARSSDFDGVATREYVLYADGVSWAEDADLESKYRDLVLFAALLNVADEAWKNAKIFVHTTSDEELTHIVKYVRQIEDTKLRLRIERAMDDNALARRDDARNLDNDFYKIVDLPHVAENRYGVPLKRTNEFAIYSFFVFHVRVTKQLVLLVTGLIVTALSAAFANASTLTPEVQALHRVLRLR